MLCPWPPRPHPLELALQTVLCSPPGPLPGSPPLLESQHTPLTALPGPPLPSNASSPGRWLKQRAPGPHGCFLIIQDTQVPLATLSPLTHRQALTSPLLGFPLVLCYQTGGAGPHSGAVSINHCRVCSKVECGQGQEGQRSCCPLSPARVGVAAWPPHLEEGGCCGAEREAPCCLPDGATQQLTAAHPALSLRPQTAPGTLSSQVQPTRTRAFARTQGRSPGLARTGLSWQGPLCTPFA